MRDSEEDFQRKLEFGKSGEKAVQRWLNERGWWALPTYDFSGRGAPSWQKGQQQIIAPDIHAAKDGVSRFVEVKTYAKSVLNRKRGYLVHGVPGRHWRAYQDACELTGIEGWLVVLELSAGDMLARKLDNTDTFGCSCGGCAHGGRCRAQLRQGVYWPRDSMAAIGRLDATTLALLRQEHSALHQDQLLIA